MFKILLSITMSFGLVNLIFAQTDSNESPLKISGYLETYYVYDFGEPVDHNRPDFLYSFNRHNEVNLNFGYIQAAYDNDQVRGTLALMTGTYANANLAAEPGVLKNIFEANVGVKISKTKNLWVDAGIFGSHIGFESAIGATCWNMTRSLVAENSPYYLSGAKISYTSHDDKWFLSGLILNGWQRIQRLPGNQTPAFGHQLTWTPGENISLNSSSFIGSDTPDSTRQMRYFHNFYGQFQIHEKFGFIAGFDIGAEQVTTGSSDYHTWYSPVLIGRFTLTEKWAFSARVEYYSDKDEVIISTGNVFQTFGYSVNLDVQVMENVLWRVEGRNFTSREDEIFLDSQQAPTQSNFFIGTSLSMAFN
ncbi:porin [Cyclobacterium jeungdonense]|uniref:Porin n=1 Tax=Cyclobacterium jeungdonense TaxID=708087 RepID=A0ABT8C5X2_9BACT|nr:porin [Cyclobacterium jeungdonense]MDN3687013.1 porin [Cyclobacterium jeungdonense]